MYIGAYLFEALQSLGFEWSIITRRRKFRFPMLVLVLLAAVYWLVTHPGGRPYSYISTQSGCWLRPLWACKRC